MKKGLIAVLIAANLLMLVIGVLTIPPNLRAAAGKRSPVPGAEQTAPAPEETGVSLSTEQRPDWEDFNWYIEDVVYDGVPSDANIIDNIGPLTGSWKALIIYDPDNEYDAGAMEFLNVALAGTAESLSLTLDWYQIIWANAGEIYDETDMEDSVFSGKWESGGLWASGAGTIRLTQFYEQNGKQYAVGTMDTPDGIPALVALVRP
jgi:hypothetical protein